MVSEEEEASEEKTKREHDFIDACVDTKVMEIAREWIFSKSKGSLAQDKNAFKVKVKRFRFLKIAIPVPWGISEELEPELESNES